MVEINDTNTVVYYTATIDHAEWQAVKAQYTNIAEAEEVIMENWRNSIKE